MEISVRTIGEVHSILMGNFGIELTVEETAELQRILGSAIHKFPPIETEDEGSQRMQVKEADELRLQINVGPFFWFLTREELAELFHVLDDLVTNRD